MKKYLLILIILLFVPFIVLAEETCQNISYGEYCKSSNATCLTSLQQEYNVWQTVGNTGVSCIKVISQINGNTRSYLNGRNPENDYKCSDGTKAKAEKIASAIPREDEVTDCNDATCYVPEIWKMSCAATTGNNDGPTGSNNSNNNGENENVSVNSNGQITGTTDTSETGVETYFIVLFIMFVLSYLVLTLTKRYNLFKNI